MSTLLNLNPAQVEALAKLILSLQTKPPEPLNPKPASIPPSLLVHATPAGTLAAQSVVPKGESRWVAQEMPWWLLP